MFGYRFHSILSIHLIYECYHMCMLFPFFRKVRQLMRSRYEAKSKNQSKRINIFVRWKDSFWKWFRSFPFFLRWNEIFHHQPYARYIHFGAIEHMFCVFCCVDMRISCGWIHEMELTKYRTTEAPKLFNICLIKDHFPDWLISFWIGFTQIYLARFMRIKV